MCALRHICVRSPAIVIGDSCYSHASLRRRSSGGDDIVAMFRASVSYQPTSASFS